MRHHDPGPDVRVEVDACFATLRDWVDAFAPELVVVIGPDHFNGFFYRLLPAFCIGVEATSVGDWATPAGPLPVAVREAEACVSALHRAGVDAALSWRMEVDHGLTQGLQMLFDWSRLPPLIPVFVNCAAPPRPPFARVVALGRALGDFARGLNRRVLILGSGGLSHDPPLPRLADAPPEVRERLVAGGPLAPAARAAREAQVLAEGLRLQAGNSAATPLNPVWDRAVLRLVEARDLAALAAFDDATVTRDAGGGGHEIRTWAATAAALADSPEAVARVRLYRTIPAWVAGFGVLSFG
jgi:2,3-dihydroxyphenylpropionate 1,2-dioxygenase